MVGYHELAIASSSYQKSSHEEARNTMMISMKMNNQDRLIPKRGRIKAGIVLALVHSVLAFFSINNCINTRSPLTPP